MRHGFRFAALLFLGSLPVVAFAKPPLIYNQLSHMEAHPGANLRIVLDSQDVQITVKPVKVVTVTVNIWARVNSRAEGQKVARRLAPTVGMQGEDVLVRTPETQGSHWSFGWEESPQVLVSVTMPPGMNVVYKTDSGDFLFDNSAATTAISGQSDSGDASVRSASNKLALRSDSGDLKVAIGGNADSVQLHTDSGDADFRGRAASLNLASDSGDIEVSDAVTQSASLDSDSGDIEARWGKLPANASIEANSDSGDVKMYFPPDTRLGGEIASGSGDVETQFPASGKPGGQAYTFAGASGAVTLKLNSGSGDVTLRKGS